MDFKPDAVRLLVDRMKKNMKTGAACGRIHPIGTGKTGWPVEGYILLEQVRQGGLWKDTSYWNR